MHAYHVASVVLLLFFGCRGPREIDSTQALIEALRSEHAAERRQAALEFRDLERVPAEAVPALLAALKDDDQQVRIAAAAALARLGADGQPYLDALADARAQDDEPAVQMAIERTMAEIAKAAAPQK